ncbi:MAG: dephospho-CoA kinase [Methylococcaceae bacterium]|nr:dephospho-CoA kinase [Methylococcaceae bacterium]
MYKVGLTGGIGCGKTTVSNLFKQLSVPVIDADDIAHALVSTAGIALAQISQQFGKSFILADGHLNRGKLRETIFNDAEKKAQLENIMHPLIYAEIKRQLSELSSPYAILAIPLLLETKMQALVDHILVIDCPMEVQINRVKSRDKLSAVQITAIINSQVSRAERLAQADSVIDNTQDLQKLSRQVHLLHKQFLRQAQ